MVLHGGDVVVHAGVEEGQHDLFFGEGQAMELGVWLSAQRVVVGCFGHLESLDLIVHEAEHDLVALVFVAVPCLADPLLQFLVPPSQDLEHQVDAFLILEVSCLIANPEHLLLLHNLIEMVAKDVETAFHVCAAVIF